jgi:hypothetical protein
MKYCLFFCMVFLLGMKVHLQERVETSGIKMKFSIPSSSPFWKSGDSGNDYTQRDEHQIAFYHYLITTVLDFTTTQLIVLQSVPNQLAASLLLEIQESEAHSYDYELLNESMKVIYANVFLPEKTNIPMAMYRVGVYYLKINSPQIYESIKLFKIVKE